MQGLTTSHAQQWRVETRTSGRGAVYQGRFLAMPVQADGHFLRVCRYVERNPVRATLVTRADTGSGRARGTLRTTGHSPAGARTVAGCTAGGLDGALACRDIAEPRSGDSTRDATRTAVRLDGLADARVGHNGRATALRGRPRGARTGKTVSPK